MGTLGSLGAAKASPANNNNNEPGSPTGSHSSHVSHISRTSSRRSVSPKRSRSQLKMSLALQEMNQQLSSRVFETEEARAAAEVRVCGFVVLIVCASVLLCAVGCGCRELRRLFGVRVSRVLS